MARRKHDLTPHLADAVASGVAAGALSGLVLAWRGRVERGRAAAPVNAPSHWIWGRPALQADGVSVRHTGLGLLVHQGSSFLWSAAYAALQAWRARPSTATRLADAIAVTALAAVVDLRLVPERLTPGFERRLSRRGVAMVYVSFAAGLALGAAALARRR